MRPDNSLYDTVRKTRRAPATAGVALGLTALMLAGCGVLPGTDRDDEVAMEPVAPEVPPMDTLLLSDLLRFYLDGDMEMDRGIVDCYGGQCLQTDGERIVFSFPEFYVFAGFHDEFITAHEGTIEDRNGIMIGDISHNEKPLPDIPGVATERTTTGWGGWGQYVGFDVLYFDYVRYDRDEGRDRPQRLIEASLGGYSSPGNPTGENLTWTGGAVAIDHSVIAEDRNLVGDAELSVYLHERFAEALGDLVRVDITNLTDVVTGMTYEDMTWRNMPLRDGQFETFQIRGQFFGPNHEEVGGIFERDSIVGAFGATREEME